MVPGEQHLESHPACPYGITHSGETGGASCVHGAAHCRCICALGECPPALIDWRALVKEDDHGFRLLGVRCLVKSSEPGCPGPNLISVMTYGIENQSSSSLPALDRPDPINYKKARSTSTQQLYQSLICYPNSCSHQISNFDYTPPS